MEEEEQTQLEPATAQRPLESAPDAAQRETFGSDGEALAHHEV
jgi:hypothetical protein